MKFDAEQMLKNELGERFKAWHLIEVERLIEQGTEVEKAVKSFVKKLNKKR